MNRLTLQRLVERWQAAVFGRDLLWSVGVGLLVLIPTLFGNGERAGWVFCVPCAAVLIARLAVSRPWRIDSARIARHLDRTYPELEESSTLFLKPSEQLTPLERLQLQRVDSAVAARNRDNNIASPLGLPPAHFLTTAVVWLCAALILLAAVDFVIRCHPAAPPANQSAAAGVTGPQTPAPTAPILPRITGGGLLITPPAYTGRPPRRVDGFNAEVEEGASVAWTLALDRPVREARLVFGEGAAGTLVLETHSRVTGMELSGTRRVTEAGLYHLAATLTDGTAWNPPELFALKVIEDRPPVVRIVQPAQARTVVAPPVPPAPPPRVEVEVEAADDYGITDIRIIATVAKGSGEGVKFREVPLAFDTDTRLPDGSTRRLTRTLDLGALGLEPGDELYFFIQAYDNRQPNANRTRSETRFITLQGPQEKTVAVGKGVTGINLVPQYFRSERQIIIDTEKLIADRPTLPDKDFRDRANSLGIDQQLLRLRYGQLLGEELESSAGDHAEVALDPLQRTAPEQRAGPRAAASITQRFLQEHEEQDREGGSDEQREAGTRPDHPDKPLSAGEVVAPFVDQHDSQDKSTYFDGGARGTMKDALAAMWDAEKFLRTARPEEALAPEHRALEILKDLQQSARAYVQHVGFDAPPIKVAERRLTGDASDVPARGSVTDELAPGDPAAQAAREALAALSSVAKAPVGAETFGALRRVEPALTAAATRQPEVFLPGLQALRRITADAGRTPISPEDHRAVQRALLRCLPPARPLPNRVKEDDPSLARLYFRTLQAIGNPEGHP